MSIFVLYEKITVPEHGGSSGYCGLASYYPVGYDEKMCPAFKTKEDAEKFIEEYDLSCKIIELKLQ